MTANEYMKKIKDDLDSVEQNLEQIQCDDCIPRQAAQAKIKSICDEYRLSYEDGERKAATGGSAYALGHAFDDIPSVTPKPKTGNWIDEFGGCECSECGCLEGGYSDYCPNCGAKMVEPQESEDKE